MNNLSTTTLLCFLALFFSSATTVATAFNITNILNNFPNFVLFNTLLSQTGISPDINSRSTITILALDNATSSQLTSRPTELQRNILSVHVILDYFDSIKLRNMRIGRSIDVTTLFQASGLAQGRQGFINVSKIGNNNVGFASDVPGSNTDVRLIEVLAAQPYNVSVIYVSGIVIAPGIDDTLIPSPKRPDPPPAPAPITPPPSPYAADAPVEDSPAESPSDDKAPSGSPAPAPAPAPAPEADSPSEDIAPDVDNSADSESDSSSSRDHESIVGFVASIVLAVVMKTIAC